MKKEIVRTSNAPQAIGTYSQAVKVGDTVYLAGQIPLVPETMALESGDMRAQITRVFENLSAVAKASGGSLADVVKLNVYLTDLGHFPLVNEVMAQYFREPYPARAAVGVASLPKGAAVEMDAVMVLNKSSRRTILPGAKLVALQRAPQGGAPRMARNKGAKNAKSKGSKKRS
jgi:reactive intermediate/imine deaminase